MLDLLDYIDESTWVLCLCAFLLSSSLSMYFVPALRKLAMSMNFTDSPSARKSHSSQVPILGWVAIYLSTALPLAFFSIFFQRSDGISLMLPMYLPPSISCEENIEFKLV